MFTLTTPLPLLVLAIFLAVRLACQLKVRETNEERVSSLCRQVLLQGLTFLGVMTFFSVLREDGCWLWWAGSFQLLAVLASLDWGRRACLPSEV
jgi:hypothetical protein